MVAGRPTVRYQVLIVLLAALMTSTVLSSVSGFWRMHESFWYLLLYSAGAVLFGWIWWRVPKVAIGLAVAALIANAAALYYLPKWAHYAGLVVDQARELGLSLSQFQWDATFGGELGTVLIILVAVLIGCLVISETLSRGTTFWSIVIGTVIFGTQWVWYFDKSTGYFMGYILLGFILWTLGQAARRDALWESSGRKIGYRSHITTPVVGVLVAGLVATILPTNIDTLDLGAFGERAQEAFPVLKHLRGGGLGGGGRRFSLQATGFNPTPGTLGGSVKLDNTVALHVTPDAPLTDTLYIRGATLQVYDGKSWQPGDLKDVPIPKDGILPTYWSSNVLQDYRKFKITPSITLGNTVFSVLEPMQVEGLKSDYKVNGDDVLWATRAVAKGTAYTVSVRFPRYSAEQIRTLSQGEPGDEYRAYLQLPKTLPKRVIDMANGITGSQQHPYDKAVALEAYLRGMRYDLDVPAPPPDTDFVDQFLFNLKRGYCVYYATSMTVMLRSVGIPARYVEGFALPVASQYTEAGGKRTYAVLNSQAHAWVEAYFPGYGWVTFDPTPRADLPVVDRSTPAPRAPETTPGDNGNSSSTKPSGDPNQKEMREGMDMTDGGSSGTGSGAAAARREWSWGLTALAALAAALLLAYRRLKAQDRIAASDERGLVQEAWTKSSGLMQMFGFGRAPGQTATEYAHSLGQKWPALRDPALQVAQDYTNARYAPPDRPVPPEAPSRARELFRKVHEVLFERYGWRTYLWRRLRWRKGPDA